MTDSDKVNEAANRLEDIAADAKQAVVELRERMDQKWAYWRLYYLRSELSRIVTTLGAGYPQAGSWKRKLQ